MPDEIYPTNIHDYLANTPAPPVDEDGLKIALGNVKWYTSVEDAARAIIEEDRKHG